MTNRKPTGAALLDLPAGLGQRAETIRYDVLQPDRSLAFTCSQPERATASIAWDANSQTQRTLHGLALGPRDVARIDPTVHRLAPKWVLDDGTEFACGLFLFSTPAFPQLAGQQFMNADLADQSVVLNQGRESSYNLGPYSPLLPAIMGLVDEVGLVPYVVADQVLGTTGSAPYSQPVGTSRGQILDDLLLAAGMYPAFFDNAGNLRLKLVPNPLSTAQADVVLSTGPSGRIVRDSIQRGNNLATAPNRYLVVGSATSQAEVSGYFDVPDNAPHSFARRGYRVVKRIDVQAASDNTAAVAAAQAAYANDFDTYDEVKFDTSPDPRSDGFQVVNFLGTNYREQSFTLPLAPGARMSHVARKVYQPSQ